MANFRAYPGMFVLCTKDLGPFKMGEKYQILHVPNVQFAGVSFIGIQHWVRGNEIGKHFSPLPFMPPEEAYDLSKPIK